MRDPGNEVEYSADCLLKNRDWEYGSERSLSFTDTRKKNKKQNKTKTNNKQQKNSETFKEGNAPIISDSLSAVHFIQVGVS